MTIRLRIPKQGLAWTLAAVIITTAAVVTYIEARTVQAILAMRIVYLEDELTRRVSAVERAVAEVAHRDTDEHTSTAWRVQEIELRQDLTINLKSLGMNARLMLASEIYRQRLYNRLGPVDGGK